MKTENRELLGFNVPIVNICETLEECIAAAGSEAEVVKTYVGDVLAHSHYTVARRHIVKTLVELTGIKQLTSKVKEKEVVTETDGEYIARLESEIGEDVLKSYEKQVAAAVGKVAVDYAPGTRGSGGSATPAKKWLAYYDALKQDETKFSAFCSKHDIDTSSDEETLKIAVANKIKDIVSAKLALAAKEAMDVS